LAAAAVADSAAVAAAAFVAAAADVAEEPIVNRWRIQ
jgi:hypothetical protein